MNRYHRATSSYRATSNRFPPILLFLFYAVLSLLTYHLSFTRLFLPEATQWEYVQEKEQRLLCELLPERTATGIWVKMRSKILDIVSRHPDDPDNPFNHNWTASILDRLPLWNLRKSAHSLPAFHDLDWVLEKVEARLIEHGLRNHADANKDEVPPPLHIVVLGGSVTMGSLCGQYLPPNVTAGGRCSWTFQLEHLINSIAGVEIVRITNIANSGTTSDAGIPLIKYAMYPQNTVPPTGPDIVIVAYNVNDAGTREGKDFFYKLRGYHNDLINVIHEVRCEKPPLIIYMNEYFGEMVENIIATSLRYNSLTKQLADWYHFMLVDYVNVVKDLVYSDRFEKDLSPRWRDDQDKAKWEMHPNLGGHIAITFVFAYGIIDAIASFCDSERYRVQSTNHTMQLPVFPPPLTNDLTIEDAAKAWPNTTMKHRCNEGNPCVYSWVGGRMGSVRNIADLNRKVQEITVMNKGWTANGTDSKLPYLGFDATESKAMFQVEMKNLPDRVSSVTLLTLKSYGEKWNNSMVLVTVHVDGKESNSSTSQQYSTEIKGFHNVATSITVRTEITLGSGVEAGGSISMKVELVTGGTFKIFSMAFCRNPGPPILATGMKFTDVNSDALLL